MRRMHWFVGAVLAGVFVIAGCSTLDRAAERRALYVDEHPDLTDRFAESILNERIEVGMSTEMVEISWGRPSRVEAYEGEESVGTLWIYGNYFTGGTLSNLYFNEESVLVKYEVRDQSTHANSGSIDKRSVETSGPAISGDGTLTKGPGGSPR